MNEAKINQIKLLATMYPKGYLTNKDTILLVQKIEELETKNQKITYSIQKYDLRLMDGEWYVCAREDINLWVRYHCESVLNVPKIKEFVDNYNENF